MPNTRLGEIAVYMPQKIESNDQLQAEFPRWDMDLIYSKTGIRQRYIADHAQCSSDLGVAAAEKLFEENNIDRNTIDFLLFCTQSPDYPLPTTACLVQDRLNLPTSVGAFDFNLGCSGYVYGASMADAMIRSSMAKRVLLITAETYSKYIDQADRSLRTIFSDGATATLIEATEDQQLSGFVFGTDGKEADALIVNTGGARPPEDAIQTRKRKRWASELYMDGPALINYTVQEIPRLVDAVLSKSNLGRDDIDLFIFHQATRKMLEMLQEQLEVSDDRLPIMLENYGNTVSSTIPILIQELRTQGRLKSGMKTMLVGFGVGFSLAGCIYEVQ